MVVVLQNAVHLKAAGDGRKRCYRSAGDLPRPHQRAADVCIGCADRVLATFQNARGVQTHGLPTSLHLTNEFLDVDGLFPRRPRGGQSLPASSAIRSSSA